MDLFALLTLAALWLCTICFVIQQDYLQKLSELSDQSAGFHNFFFFFIPALLCLFDRIYTHDVFLTDKYQGSRMPHFLFSNLIGRLFY